MKAATPASSPRALLCNTVRHSNDPDAGPDFGLARRPAFPGAAALLTSPARGHAQSAGPPMDTVPNCPLPGAKTGHVRRLTTPRTGHAQPVGLWMDIAPICPLITAKTGHVPRMRQGEFSAFMLFSIDKATDSKIKSINSTPCDGYHGSGGKVRSTDARESQCSPKNANS